MLRLPLPLPLPPPPLQQLQQPPPRRRRPRRNPHPRRSSTWLHPALATTLTFRPTSVTSAHGRSKSSPSTSSCVQQRPHRACRRLNIRCRAPPQLTRRVPQPLIALVVQVESAQARAMRRTAHHCCRMLVGWRVPGRARRRGRAPTARDVGRMCALSNSAAPCTPRPSWCLWRRGCTSSQARSPLPTESKLRHTRLCSTSSAFARSSTLSSSRNALRSSGCHRRPPSPLALRRGRSHSLDSQSSLCAARHTPGPRAHNHIPPHILHG